MNHETKRDVFLQLAKENRDLRMYDPEAIEPKELIEQDYQYWVREYDAALPDNLPVIPKSIGDFIKQSVYEDATLQEALECAHDKHFGVGRWVSAHSEIFARAWVLGVWRVDETGEIVKLEEEK